MIISKKKYRAMCDLIATQREALKLLAEQNLLLQRKLRSEIAILMTQQQNDIDFPATEKLHEDKLF